ncbi:MAG: tyrosine-type recombinase/integrase [Propionibacteriaceae bacterium]|nr:tyrosine-type recombinase/integrase [Propionibacteriaceae bacterium]
MTGGTLGDRIGAYVAAKRAVGKTFQQGEYYLRRFERHCAETGHTSPTREAIEGFVAQVEVGRPDAARGWVSYLRGFARWELNLGDAAACPPPGLRAPRRARPEPYLFSEAELDRFFEAAAALRHAPPWPWQAKAFFGLMFACGLRTCEARRLDRADVDLGAGTISVRDSKGPRSRLLPVTEEVAATLDACDRENTRRWPSRQALFAVRGGRRVGPGAPAAVFNRIWDAAGLPRPEAGSRQPRPYDLRHHFGYGNIERWAAEGRDPDAMLPYLARYMGHASPASTLCYIHVSPGLITSRAACADRSEDLLPEAGFDD